MLLDIHTHTRQRSPCSSVDEEDLILHAIQKGLDGIAITDHEKLVPAPRLLELNRKYEPFRIFTGIEIQAGIDDYLVIGIGDERIESLHEYTALREFVRVHHGWIALAHPFRYGPHIPDEVLRDPPDALEYYSINIGNKNRPRIKELSEQWKAPLVAVSDAHDTGAVGMYAIRLRRRVDSDGELVKQLCEGAFDIVNNSPAGATDG